VGGTELNEGSNPEQYWASANSAGYESALGYIPEEVWNESGMNGGTELWSSGGGASRVYAQPAWQADVTGSNVANGMRAVPDVALSAASHDGYLIRENSSDWIISGTSAATPAFAGVMALVVETMGGVGQGSVNARLYALADLVPNAFHSTPEGNNSVPGVTGFWANGATYNLATGLGSVDGTALVRNWRSGTELAPTLTLSGATDPIVVAQGGVATVSFAVATGGSFAGSINLSVSGVAPGLTTAWAANPVAVAAGGSTATLAVMASGLAAEGVSSITVTAAGDGASTSESVSVQVQPPRVCSGSLRVPCGTPMPVRSQTQR
jgi:subtilase family serine protease